MVREPVISSSVEASSEDADVCSAAALVVSVSGAAVSAVFSVDGAGAVDDELPQAVRLPARRAVHVNSARTFFPFIMNPPYICCNLEIMYPLYIF